MITRIVLFGPVALGFLHFSCSRAGEVLCPPPEHLEGSVCVRNAGASSCGPGTRNEAGVCLPAEPTSCAANAVPIAGECRAPDAPTVFCGPGTLVRGNQCVPDPDAGHEASNGREYFDLRVASRRIVADGYARIPVLALARAADGMPITESLILGLSRASAGSFKEIDGAMPGPLGQTIDFIPCSTASAACVGKAQLTMARASAPDVVLAKSEEFELVPANPVASAGECIGQPNVVYLDGDPGDRVHPGIETLPSASSNAYAREEGTGGLNVVIFNHASVGRDPQYWQAHFETVSIGIPFQSQVYEHATGVGELTAERPRFSISNRTSGCAYGSGSFEVHTLKLSASNEIQEALVSFEQRCNGSTATLRGCMHYTR
jgi:hypothetical protein